MPDIGECAACRLEFLNDIENLLLVVVGPNRLKDEFVLIKYRRLCACVSYVNGKLHSDTKPFAWQRYANPPDEQNFWKNTSVGKGKGMVQG